MKQLLPILAAISLLAGGCGVYGSYSRPELDVDVDSLFREPGGDSSSIAAMPWRELLADTCLQNLVAAALDRNTDLEIARLQVQEAQALLDKARLQYFPSVTASPQASVSSFDGAVKKTYSLGASASWEVDLPGRLTNAKRSAEASLMEREAYAASVRSAVVASVAGYYYSLLLLDEELAISSESLSNWDATVSVLEALVSAGRSNDVAVRQARASRNALEASVLTLRSDIRSAENALCALLKETPHAVERGALGSQVFPETLSAGLPVRMLTARPDVRQAEAALAAAFYDVNAARAAFYPSLTLAGSLGWTDSGGGVVTDPGALLLSAVGSLVAPLFNGGTNRANLKIALARQQEALLGFEQTLLDAGNEVNDALSLWQTARERVLLDELRVEDLEAAVEKTGLLMRYSSATYLEVLSAQQSLLEARRTLAGDRTDMMLAVVELFRALGGASE